VLIQEEATGETKRPVEPVTTTVGPWWPQQPVVAPPPPVNVFSFCGCSASDDFERFAFVLQL